jgi:hypothetical protein
MRVFTTECKDTKTPYSMVLSECSYNMAMKWLHDTLWKYKVEICRCFMNDKGLMEIWTAKFDDTINNYRPMRHYFYDEERGYLLGE